MNINQPVTIFWGGPIHGEYKELRGPSFYVPVFTPIEDTFAITISEPDATVPVHKMFKTILYNQHQFTWRWKSGWCSGFAMIPSPASWWVFELETVLNVLGGLWGGGNHENENLYA